MLILQHYSLLNDQREASLKSLGVSHGKHIPDNQLNRMVMVADAFWLATFPAAAAGAIV
jgi:hypothetical protein